MTSFPVTTVFEVLGGALLISWLTTPLMCAIAVRAALFDRPDTRKVHATPTPLLGGLAMYLGVIISLGVLFAARPELRAQLHEWPWLLAAATLITIGGAWDDARRWPAWIKLLWQLLAAALVYAGHVRMAVLTNPLNGTEITLPPWLSFIVTVGWIVSVVNALNLMDGLDGLAAGVVAIVALFLLGIAYSLNNIITVCVLGAVAGACLGFLYYNWPPAKIFMGDAGSQLLGLCLGVAPLLEFQYKAATAVALMVPLTTLAIPISDVALAIVRRLQGRRSIFRADKQHLHHRLLELGLSQRQVVLLMYLMTAYLGVIAILFVLTPQQYASVLLVLLALGLFMGMRTIGFIERRLRYVYLQQAKRHRGEM